MLFLKYPTDFTANTGEKKSYCPTEYMGYIHAQTSPSKTTKTLLVLCLTAFDTWHMYICAMVDPANCHSYFRL